MTGYEVKRDALRKHTRVLAELADSISVIANKISDAYILSDAFSGAGSKPNSVYARARANYVSDLLQTQNALNSAIRAIKFAESSYGKADSVVAAGIEKLEEFDQHRPPQHNPGGLDKLVLPRSVQP